MNSECTGLWRALGRCRWGGGRRYCHPNLLGWRKEILSSQSSCQTAESVLIANPRRATYVLRFLSRSLLGRTEMRQVGSLLLKGETLYHFIYVSSFSEYTVVDIAHVVKIDPAVPHNRACRLSCGVSTGVGAAWRTANVEAGSTVAIFALKAIGLAVADGARLCGASKKSVWMLTLTRLKQVIMETTGGGADYCFECVGMASLVHEAFACC